MSLNDRGIGLGGGDYIATGHAQSLGTMNPTAAFCQSTVLTNPDVFDRGRAVVADWANVGTRAANSVTPGDDNSIWANFLLAATAADRTRHVFVLDRNTRPGGQAFGVFDGLVEVLVADTIANLPIDTPVTISIAADNGRGCFIPATSGTPVLGKIVKPPTVNGSAAAPQIATIVFFGNGLHTRPLP